MELLDAFWALSYGPPGVGSGVGEPAELDVPRVELETEPVLGEVDVLAVRDLRHKQIVSSKW